MIDPRRARAQRVIAAVRAEDDDVVALAQVVSLAVAIDPRLLRIARLEFFAPGPDRGRGRGPDLEADLWHSPLIASSNATGLLLDADVGAELRLGLARNPARYEAARRLIEREHRWLPDTLKLEEELRYLALVRGGPAQAQRRLRELDDHLREHDGLAPWVEGLYARLPPGLAPDHRGVLAPAPGFQRPRGAGGATVGVRLLDGAVEFRAGAPAADWHELTLTAHAPPLVHVDERLVDLDDLPRLHPAGRGDVSIQTLDGSRLTLQRRGRRRAERRPPSPTAREVALVAVAFSPDGELVAGGGLMGGVRVWNSATGRELATLSGPPTIVWDIAFSPDGRLLATASEDGWLRIWDVAYARQVRGERISRRELVAVTFSPDGRLLAAAGADGEVRLWEMSAAGEGRALRGHDEEVNGLAFSPDGRLLASAGDDGAVRLWDVASGDTTALLPHVGIVLGVSFAADGRFLATAGGDGTVRIWDQAAAAITTELRGHRGVVWGVAVAPDGRLVVSAGEDGTLRLWDLTKAKEVAVLLRGEGRLWRTAFSADGRLVATAQKQAVRVWDVASRHEAVRPFVVEGGPRRARFAPEADGSPSNEKGAERPDARGVDLSMDGRLVASAGADGIVRIWDVASGRLLHALSAHFGEVNGVAFSSDGRLLASVGDEGTVRLWDVASGGEVAALGTRAAIMLSVAFSPDGRLLATGGGGDGEVRLWDVATRREERSLSGNHGLVWDVAFSPDGRLVASAGGDSIVRAWDVASGRLELKWDNEDVEANGVAFSRDGRQLVFGDDEGFVRVLSVLDGRVTSSWGDNGGIVRGIAFSPDARLLASTSTDGAVRLRDVASGRVAAVLHSGGGGLLSVAFSADGRMLATAGHGVTATAWDVGTPGSGVLRGGPGTHCALGAAAIAIAGGRWRWATLLGIGSGAVPAALLAAGIDGDEVRRLLVDRDLGGRLVAGHGAGFAVRRRLGASAFERRLATALGDAGVRGWGDLAVPVPRALDASALQLALLDVATDRVVLLPRDAAALGLDPAELPVARLVMAADGGASGREVVTVGGRRFASALGRPLDLRPAFADQPAWQPAVLVDAGGPPRPRWPSEGRFGVVEIADLAAGEDRRPSRAQREVLALIGADAARRAPSVQTLDEVGDPEARAVAAAERAESRSTTA